MKWTPISTPPPINSRCLVLEADGNTEICIYCKSYWNTPTGSIGYLNEQDEQPSMCYPTHYILVSELTSLPKL